MAVAFDPCPHKITQIVLKAGVVIRQLKGLPEEKNITVLYNETAPLLGIPVRDPTMNTTYANHLPSPSEMRGDNGKFTILRKDCPKCHRKESMQLFPLCQSCADAEGGKFKTMWFCGNKDIQGNLVENSGCGLKDKSEKFLTQWLNELGIEIPTGPKAQLGIKTVTDEGLK